MANEVYPGVWELRRIGPVLIKYVKHNTYPRYTSPYLAHLNNTLNRVLGYSGDTHADPQNRGAEIWHQHDIPFIICIQSNKPKQGTLIGLDPPVKSSNRYMPRITNSYFRAVVQLKLNTLYLIEPDIFHRSPLPKAGTWRWMYRCWIKRNYRDELKSICQDIVNAL